MTKKLSLLQNGKRDEKYKFYKFEEFHKYRIDKVDEGETSNRIGIAVNNESGAVKFVDKFLTKGENGEVT